MGQVVKLRTTAPKMKTANLKEYINPFRSPFELKCRNPKLIKISKKAELKTSWSMKIKTKSQIKVLRFLIRIEKVSLDKEKINNKKLRRMA
jgi:hypothetical protein